MFEVIEPKELTFILAIMNEDGIDGLKTKELEQVMNEVISWLW